MQSPPLSSDTEGCDEPNFLIVRFFGTSFPSDSSFSSVDLAVEGRGSLARFVLVGDDLVPGFWGERRFLSERSGTASSSRERARGAMVSIYGTWNRWSVECCTSWNFHGILARYGCQWQRGFLGRAETSTAKLKMCSQRSTKNNKGTKTAKYNMQKQTRPSGKLAKEYQDYVVPV